jgi:hypothetical protein
VPEQEQGDERGADLNPGAASDGADECLGVRILFLRRLGQILL